MESADFPDSIGELRAALRAKKDDEAARLNEIQYIERQLKTSTGYVLASLIGSFGGSVLSPVTGGFSTIVTLLGWLMFVKSLVDDAKLMNRKLAKQRELSVLRGDLDAIEAKIAAIDAESR